MNNYLAIIKSKFPSFVKRDYPTFTALMEAYFTHLYETGNPLEYLSNYLDEYDTSNENSRYWDAILADLGFLLDTPITIQKRQLVIFLRDYYTARGSEQGLYFLFKLLFNDEPTVSYPREDMLIPSVALAESDKIVYVDLSRVKQKEIYKLKSEIANYTLYGKGETSNTQFNIDKCFVYGKVGKMIVSISGDLIPFETIRLSTGLTVPSLCALTVETLKSNNPVKPNSHLDIKGNRLNGDYRIKQVSSGKIDDVVINSGGADYKIGDAVIVVGSTTTGFYGEVVNVDVNGAITRIAVLNKGYNMKAYPTLAVLSESGSGAKITPLSDSIGKPLTVSVSEPCVVDSDFNKFTQTTNGIECGLSLQSVFVSPKKQKLSTGTLGLNGVITDSYYYQQFSYRINSAIPKAEYAHKVKTDHHPAGTVMLARLLISEEKPISANLNATIEIT